MPARTVGRIQSRMAFGQLQRSRARASCGPIRASFVAVEPGAPGVFPQVGYAIGTHCGNAVVRNTLRRRLRESARQVAETLPRGQYLLRAEPTAASTEPAQLAACVAQAMQRAGSAQAAR
jgi:ribonuclease P protein component